MRKVKKSPSISFHGFIFPPIFCSSCPLSVFVIFFLLPFKFLHLPFVLNFDDYNLGLLIFKPLGILFENLDGVRENKSRSVDIVFINCLFMLNSLPPQSNHDRASDKMKQTASKRQEKSLSDFTSRINASD